MWLPWDNLKNWIIIQNIAVVNENKNDLCSFLLQRFAAKNDIAQSFVVKCRLNKNVNP